VKITAVVDFADGKKTFAKGRSYTVDHDRGVHFVSAGWAKTDEEVTGPAKPASPTKNEVK
jgi:hypothetical protein